MSELYGMAHSFNMGVSIKLIINKMLGIELLLVVYIDSKSLYKCLIKLGIIQEKRLIVNIICLY